MARPKKPIGGVHPETLQKMTKDYVIKKMSVKVISESYNLGLTTVKKISKSNDWVNKRRKWNDKNTKKATTQRLDVSNRIIGKMMDIMDRHADNILSMSNGEAVIHPIPKYVVDEAYKLMKYMDGVASLVRSSRETSTPDKIFVEAPGLDYHSINMKSELKSTKGEDQLKEWEESRKAKPNKKEPEDVFDAQSEEIKPDDEDITFEGLNDVDDGQQDDSPIGGILD